MRTILICLLLCLTGAALAQDAPTMEAALLSRVSVGRLRTPARHCRDAHDGCAARIHAFVGYMQASGGTHGIDPWLLAAMAFRESALNPFAVGGVIEGGIMQINPCRPDLPDAVRDFVGPCPRSTEADAETRRARAERFRHRCALVLGECQEPIVEYAAGLMERALVRCAGSEEHALTVYNGGPCGPSDYATRVLRERERLRSGDAP